MNKKAVRLVAIIIILMMILSSFSFVFFVPGLFGSAPSYAYGAETVSDSQLSSKMEELEAYLRFLKGTYKDNVDYSIMVEGAFTGATAALSDKYTEYYTQPEEGASFMETVTGEFSGIGVTIEKDEEGAKVVALSKNGPAEKGGILVADVIVSIDGKETKALSLGQISAYLKGEKGTSVTLRVKRVGQYFTYTLVRDLIKSSSVSGEMVAQNIGHIRILSFDNDTENEFEIVLRDLIGKGATSIIIDLRDNGGGLIGSAVGVANRLLDEQAIFHYYQQDRLVKTVSAAGISNYKLPTVVLVNENTASASETLAGSLKDNKVATLVGTRTFGKGIAQIIYNVNANKQAKISTFYFTTPNNTPINGVGIAPDVLVQNYAPKSSEVILQLESFAPMNETKKPKAGDTGLNVYGAQQRLRLLGYDVVVSGTMDTKTVSAVSKFQRDQGKVPYGVLDYTTKDLLLKAALSYVYGTGEGDKQLEKGIELLKK